MSHYSSWFRSVRSVRSVWSVWSVRYSSCFRVGAVYSAWSRTRFLNWICTTAVFLPWCSALHLIIRSGWDVDDPSWDLSDLSDQFDFGVNMKRSLHSRPALSAAIECLRVYHIFSFLRRCKCVCDLPHQVDHTFSPARSHHTTFNASIHNYSNFTVDMTSPACGCGCSTYGVLIWFRSSGGRMTDTLRNLRNVIQGNTCCMSRL